MPVSWSAPTRTPTASRSSPARRRPLPRSTAPGRGPRDPRRGHRPALPAAVAVTDWPAEGAALALLAGMPAPANPASSATTPSPGPAMMRIGSPRFSRSSCSNGMRQQHHVGCSPVCPGSGQMAAENTKPGGPGAPAAGSRQDCGCDSSGNQRADFHAPVNADRRSHTRSSQGRTGEPRSGVPPQRSVWSCQRGSSQSRVWTLPAGRRARRVSVRSSWGNTLSLIVRSWLVAWSSRWLVPTL
jgi:hypothetical protein